MRAFKKLLTPRAVALCVALLAVAATGCNSEDVTGPVQQQVAPPTGNQGSSATWNITVSTSANTVDLNDGSAIIQIEVSARRADNNQSVAPGTTALLSTTAGQLTGNSGTAASIPIEFDAGGVARATLTTGTLTSEGVIIVRAQIESSIGSARITIVDVPAEAFQITSVSPASGPPSGGTFLTITGSGFKSPLRASITVLGQTLLLEDVRVSSSSRITGVTPSINLPSGQNATGAISVENAFDETGAPTATDTLAGAFTYTRSSSGPTTLKLISLTPTFGPNEGGTQVSVIGEGFGNQVQVYFTNGPLVESQVLSVTANRLEVVTPSATGPNASNGNSIVDLRVVDPVSGQTASLNGAFQYGRGAGGALFISAISPGQDEYLGGRLVTIFGQGFEEPVAVEMGNVGQQIISVTGTEVVVRTVPVSIGCANQAGAVSLVNIETNEGTNGPVFTYVPIDVTLVSVSPSTGASGGNTLITITGVPRSFGLGFDPPVRVTVNGVQATVNSVSGSTITALTPAFTGTFTTTSCTDSNGNTGTQQVNAPVTVAVTNLNTGCNDSLTNSFTYLAPNSTCQVPLVANFEIGSQVGLSVQFNDLSTGSPDSYSWDFGDGTSSSTANPSHVYALPGTYSVTLTVSRGTVSDSVAKSVTAPPP